MILAISKSLSAVLSFSSPANFRPKVSSMTGLTASKEQFWPQFFLKSAILSVKAWKDIFWPVSTS